MVYDGTGTLAAYIASRSDIDDLIPILVTYQIEWNKLHLLLNSEAVRLFLVQNEGEARPLTDAERAMLEAQTAAERERAAAMAARADELEAERLRRVTERDDLEQQYTAAAKREIDTSGAYAARFGEGPLGMLAVTLQAVAAGMYGKGDTWAKDVKGSVDTWVEEQKRLRGVELAAIDKKLGYANAGVDMLTEQAYDATQRAFGARLEGMGADPIKAAAGQKIQAQLLAGASEAQGRAAQRRAAEADKRYQRGLDARRESRADAQLAMQRDEMQLRRDALAAEAERNGVKARNDEEQRILSSKVGKDGTLGSAVSRYRANEEFMKKVGGFDWSSSPGRWSAGQKAALQAFVGGGVAIDSERALKAALIQKRAEQKNATGGALTTEEARELDRLALPQLITEVQAGHSSHKAELSQAMRTYNVPGELQQRFMGDLDYTVSARRPK